MRIVCAWCERNGTPNVIMVRPSWNDDAVSHGICAAHAAAYRHTLRGEHHTHGPSDPPADSTASTSSLAAKVTGWFTSRN